MPAPRESRFAERTENHQPTTTGGQLVTFSHVGDEEDMCVGERLAPALTGLALSAATSRSTGPPAYSQTLPREAGSAAVARRLVRAALTLWGLESLIDDTSLVMTELVSNAADHSRLSAIRVIVSRPSAQEVRVGVVDRSRAVPMLPANSGGDHVRGRGLLLVDTLSERWGTELYLWGKQVWAELKGEGTP
ncbi:ATP-binding protein [Streptomyces sp. NPDC055893]